MAPRWAHPPLIEREHPSSWQRNANFGIHDGDAPLFRHQRNNLQNTYQQAAPSHHLRLFSCSAPAHPDEAICSNSQLRYTIRTPSFPETEEAMGYEIDFLPVGKASSGGDAIAVRYGDLYGSRSEQTVIIIDGGYAANGDDLVKHVRRYYQAEYVDLVISTHPDQDHIGGLRTIIEELASSKHTQLLMHCPGRHTDRKALLQKASLDERFSKSLQGAADLEAIATERSIEIIEPFTGFCTRDGALAIVGPSKSYYEELLQNIGVLSNLQAAIEELQKALAMRTGESYTEESHDAETLTDDGITSYQNNTSTITLLEVDKRFSLFTADAGIPALEQVVGSLRAVGISAGGLNFIQVPHHGSRNNVGPSILDQLLGEPMEGTLRGTAFASVPPENPRGIHPAKKVTNAFHRRGYQVHITAGSAKRYSYNAPRRENFVTSEPVPFYGVVEDDGG